MKDKILELLHLHTYMKRRELLGSLIANGYYVSDRALRQLIEEMITKDHYVIGSGDKGYYLIVTDTHLDEAMHQLRSKAEALSIRANCLLRNYKEGKMTEQLALFI